MPGFDAIGRLALGQLPTIAGPFSAAPDPAPTRPRSSIASQVLGSSMVLLVTVPFVNIDRVQAKPVRIAAPDQVHTNVNLFSEVPFRQSSWPQTFRVPLLPSLQATPLNLNLFKNPIPFGPFDYNKTVRVPSVPQPPHGMGYNANLYKNNIPFGPFDWSKAVKQSPQPDHPPYNLALLGAQVVAAPFSLDDYGKPFVPTAAPPQLLPRNPNLFSEVPLAGQVSAKPFDIPGLSAFAPPLNLSLTAVVQPPFSQDDWSVTGRLKGSAPDQAARNPLIFSEVPFSQDDWATSKPIPRFAAPDRSYNVLIYSEVPFGQKDWSKGQAVNISPAWLPGYNGNLYGVVAPAPFVAIDWAKPFAIRALPAGPAPLNVNLFTNPLPFAQYDWSKPQRLQGALYPAPQPYNQSFYANPIPFAQFDWSRPSAFTSASNALQQFNPNLSTVVVQSPFYQTDWSVTVRAKSAAVDQPNRNPLIFSEVPFSQGDWSKPSRVASAPGAPLPLNLSLSIVVQNPFSQTDWSVSVRSKTAAVDQVARNALILSEVPFYQTDWPKVYDLVGLLPGSGPLNLNLFSNPAPFAQYDWSRPQQSPNWQGAKSSDFNLGLASAPVAPPFFQLDWSKPVNVTPVRPDQPAPNIALLVTPPPPSPFYQLDWSKTYQVVGLPPQALPFNINLYPGAAPSGPAELHNNPLLASVGRMMGRR